ncbi:hypothetical protein UFOVP282_30, partial [uncultured Caudovirales phage]
GYWTINKHLAREYGFTATALLQQLIELQCQFFPKGDFYQQQDELANTLGISEKVLVSARKKLIEANLLIARRGYGAKYYYTVSLDNITKFFESEESEILEDTPMESSDSTKGNIPTLQKGTANIKKQKHKEIKQEELLDETSNDDIFGKMFFKLVDMYPKNRIGNRQHGLKKFKTLDIDQAKLALVNLKRYLKVAGTYIKNLQNYITEECYTEAWLSLEETKAKRKDINDTKSFSGQY